MTTARDTIPPVPCASGNGSEVESIRRALLVAAREKLRAHLAAEASTHVADNHDRTALTDVQELAERLDATW